MKETHKYISWRRVSTFKQNRTGLGLAAQKEIIRYFIERDGGEWVADYEECYTGKELSGCVELHKAMEHAKKDGAILIIAKSDRFRNTAEALKIYEEMGDGNIMFCDLPTTDKFTLTLFFALAEREALLVSIRTKQALAAKKAQGGKIGAASDNYRISNDAARQRGAKAAITRTRRVLENRDTQALIRIMKSVFPLCAETPESEWCQSFVNTKREARMKVLTMMADYKSVDDTGRLFAKWDLADLESVNLQHKLASKMQTIIKILNQ